MCRINLSGVGVDHFFYNCIYLSLFSMYGTHVYSGSIGMFRRIIYFLFVKSNHENNYFGNILQYEYNYFAFRTNVLEYD